MRRPPTPSLIRFNALALFALILIATAASVAAELCSSVHTCATCAADDNCVFCLLGGGSVCINATQIGDFVDSCSAFVLDASQCPVSPSPSPFVEATRSPTLTSTVVSTPTVTVTATSSASVSGTTSGSSSETATPTSTVSATFSPSSTSTSSVSGSTSSTTSLTGTPSTSVSHTATYSASQSPSSTLSGSSSFTATISGTPSTSVSSTESSSVTGSPTISSSLSATASLSPSVSPTVSSTMTVSPSATRTATSTPSTTFPPLLIVGLNVTGTILNQGSDLLLSFPVRTSHALRQTCDLTISWTSSLTNETLQGVDLSSIVGTDAECTWSRTGSQLRVFLGARSRVASGDRVDIGLGSVPQNTIRQVGGEFDGYRLTGGSTLRQLASTSARDSFQIRGPRALSVDDVGSASYVLSPALDVSGRTRAQIAWTVTDPSGSVLSSIVTAGPRLELFLAAISTNESLVRLTATDRIGGTASILVERLSTVGSDCFPSFIEIAPSAEIAFQSAYTIGHRSEGTSFDEILTVSASVGFGLGSEASCDAFGDIPYQWTLPPFLSSNVGVQGPEIRVPAADVYSSVAIGSTVYLNVSACYSASSTTSPVTCLRETVAIVRLESLLSVRIVEHPFPDIPSAVTLTAVVTDESVEDGSGGTGYVYEWGCCVVNTSAVDECTMQPFALCPLKNSFSTGSGKSIVVDGSQFEEVRVQVVVRRNAGLVTSSASYTLSNSTRFSGTIIPLSTNVVVDGDSLNRTAYVLTGSILDLQYDVPASDTQSFSWHVDGDHVGTVLTPSNTSSTRFALDITDVATANAQSVVSIRSLHDNRVLSRLLVKLLHFSATGACVARGESFLSISESARLVRVSLDCSDVFVRALPPLPGSPFRFGSSVEMQARSSDGTPLFHWTSASTAFGYIVAPVSVCEVDVEVRVRIRGVQLPESSIFQSRATIPGCVAGNGVFSSGCDALPGQLQLLRRQAYIATAAPIAAFLQDSVGATSCDRATVDILHQHLHNATVNAIERCLHCQESLSIAAQSLPTLLRVADAGNHVQIRQVLTLVSSVSERFHPSDLSDPRTGVLADLLFTVTSAVMKVNAYSTQTRLSEWNTTHAQQLTSTLQIARNSMNAIAASVAVRLGRPGLQGTSSVSSDGVEASLAISSFDSSVVDDISIDGSLFPRSVLTHINTTLSRPPSGQSTLLVPLHWSYNSAFAPINGTLGANGTNVVELDSLNATKRLVSGLHEAGIIRVHVEASRVLFETVSVNNIPSSTGAIDVYIPLVRSPDGSSRCQWFDEQHRNWSTAGCQSLAEVSAHICRCNHLTQFAVFQDASSSPDADPGSSSLSTTVVVLITVSVVSGVVFAVILAAWCRRRNLRRSESDSDAGDAGDTLIGITGFNPLYSGRTETPQVAATRDFLSSLRSSRLAASDEVVTPSVPRGTSTLSSMRPDSEVQATPLTSTGGLAGHRTLLSSFLNGSRSNVLSSSSLLKSPKNVWTPPQVQHGNPLRSPRFPAPPPKSTTRTLRKKYGEAPTPLPAVGRSSTSSLSMYAPIRKSPPSNASSRPSSPGMESIRSLAMASHISSQRGGAGSSTGSRAFAPHADLENRVAPPSPPPLPPRRRAAGEVAPDSDAGGRTLDIASNASVSSAVSAEHRMEQADSRPIQRTVEHRSSDVSMEDRASSSTPSPKDDSKRRVSPVYIIPPSK